MAATRFTLSVDLDGVVGDYEAAFASAVALQKGVPLEDIGPQQAWNFADDPGWPIDSQEEFFQLHQTAVTEHRLFLHMPEIPGASDVLWKLNDLDVHIRVVTHRLVNHGDHAVVAHDTCSWLDAPRADGRPRIPYRDLCFLGSKSQLATDLAIDDAPHNVLAIREAGIDAMVMDAGYNRHLDGPRALTWDDVYDYVVARLN